jgi:hypothetical protein
MKKLKRFTLIALLSGTLLSQTSCMGSFALTLKVYEINNTITDNKFVNNLIFWIVGAPVYGFTTTVDIVILNLIEFWTGDNLLAAAPEPLGDDRWAFEGREFKLNRTHDQLHLQELQGEEVITDISLSYNAIDNSWYMALEDGKKVKMFSEIDGKVTFYFGAQSIDMASAEVESSIRGLQEQDAVWALR